jgi:hypothetical protein
LLALSTVLTLTAAPVNALAFRLGKFHIGALQIFLEFIVRIPMMVVAAYYYGVMGVLVVRFICGFYVAGVAVFLVRHLIQLPILTQLLAPWRPFLAASTMGVLVMQAVPYLQRLSNEIMLAVGFAATVAGGAAFYALMVALLWLLSGRPDGAEKIIYNKLTSGFALFRRRFA